MLIEHFPVKTLLLACALCAVSPLEAQPVNVAAPANAVWNLKDLFPSVEDWNKERERMLAEFRKIAAFKGTLGQNSEALFQALRFVWDTNKAATRVYVYASLQHDEDLRVTRTEEQDQLAAAMFAEFTQATAWMDPELISVGETRIRQFLAENPKLAPFRHQLENTLRRASHTLSADAEQALSYFAQPFDAPSNIYSILGNSDIPFPSLTLPDGEKVRLDSQGYERMRSSQDRELRKQAFDLFWGKWQEYRNSVGQVLNSHIQTQVALSKARHYNSVLERELFDDNLPPAVYHTLVEQVNKALPTLHRYFKLRARMMGIDKMHYYDIYPPLVKLNKEFTLATSKQLTLDAMKILGDDWVKQEKEAFEKGWMHVYPQQGKRSGAYMQGSAYDVHPYLLLNHNNDYESLSTLAHEWGHAMHTLYSRSQQPYETFDYATFIAEIPSTSVELMLQEHMTKQAKTPDEKLYYLGFGLEDLRGTFFRQTMFAEFELKLYEEVERGEALTGEKISQMYGELLRRYHGSDQGVVEIDPLYYNEWMFVPHFYYNMYVFQYATSLTAGTALYEKIVKEGKAGAENYKNLLRAGGSDYPYNLLLRAGVDLAKAAPYEAVVKRMNAVMDEMEKLLDQRKQ